MWMRTVQQTDLHCELTGLNILRGLSGKPEPGCLNTEADSELLSATLKSLTISPMTGISESLRNTATPVQHCDLACTNIKHMKVCTRQGLHLCTHRDTHRRKTCKLLDAERVFDIFPAFGFAEPRSKKILLCVPATNFAATRQNTHST